MDRAEEIFKLAAENESLRHENANLRAQIEIWRKLPGVRVTVFSDGKYMQKFKLKEVIPDDLQAELDRLVSLEE